MRKIRAVVPASRLLDAGYVAAMTAGTACLFVIDIHSPRGIVDGLGYPAIVALSSRFVRQTVQLSAWGTSVLVLVGAVLVPNAGISVAGELANRFFGLLSVWIVPL